MFFPVRYCLLGLCVMTLAAPETLWAQATPDFPALNGRIVDAAGILDASTEAQLDEKLAAHETETSNQIVVATVNSLEGYAIADYALRLARHWEIGTAEKNNGILLLIAPSEHKVRIEVGYGLEGALTDATASQIIRNILLPDFKKNAYSQGTLKGVDTILQAVAGEYKAVPGRSNTRDDISSKLHGIMPLLFIAMIGLPELLRRSGRRRAANGAFPAGFAGLMATVFSGNFLIGMAIGIGVFVLVFFFASNSGGGNGGSARRRGRTIGGGLGGGGFGGGGGFSGGGGGFGGGGASGSW